jgi:hypothetical protein
MTLPAERLRAVHAAYEFLCALLDSKTTPRVPRSVRRQACAILRHYPTPVEFEIRYMPRHWGEDMPR